MVRASYDTRGFAKEHIKIYIIGLYLEAPFFLTVS